MAGGANHRFRVVVVGCGAISEEHLRFLALSDHVRLEAVCDLSPALAEIARERWGAGRASVDVDEALAAIRPDVVHILTPPGTHPVLIRKALGAGAHVVCEKPLAPSAAETTSLLQYARTSQRLLVETRNLLYNDVVQSLDRALQSGEVGAVREIDVALSLDLGAADVTSDGLGLAAGIAHDYLPHLAYLLLHFAKPEVNVDHVAGVLENMSGRPELGFDHLDALATLGDVRARLRISPDVKPNSLRIAIRGSRASVEADMYQPYVRREGPPWTGMWASFGLVAQGSHLIAAGSRNVRDRLMQHGTYHGMARMLEIVYGTLRGECPPPVTEAEMVASASLIDRVTMLGKTLA